MGCCGTRDTEGCLLWETKGPPRVVLDPPAPMGQQVLHPCAPCLTLQRAQAAQKMEQPSAPLGTSLFAGELTVAESMPWLVNAPCDLKGSHLADFLASHPARLAPSTYVAEKIFAFSFPCFIKMVLVHWDKSQAQTVGCLAALCNSIVPS